MDKFCSLSTSPSWSAWLYHFDAGLFRKFRVQLQEARGCTQNREIMVALLKEIEQRESGTERVYDFLNKHYPHMLVKDGQPQAERDPEVVGGPVFGYFNPDLLTYPRRVILEGGSERELTRRAKEFLIDKIKGDFVVVDGRAYLEFLSRVDVAVVDQVPAKNWMIAEWRLRSLKET